MKNNKYVLIETYGNCLYKTIKKDKKIIGLKIFKKEDIDYEDLVVFQIGSNLKYNIKKITRKENESFYDLRYKIPKKIIPLMEMYDYKVPENNFLVTSDFEYDKNIKIIHFDYIKFLVKKDSL